MSEILNEEDLNEEFTEEMDDADVITIEIDDTLTQEGYAADAKAVGDALALKADASSVNAISVNGETADNQGAILLNAGHIPMSDAAGAPTIAEQMASMAGGQTAEEVPMSDDPGAASVADEIADIKADQVGCVKSINGITANENGNVLLSEVPFAANLTSDKATSSAGAFVERTTGGNKSVSNGNAYMQEIRGAMVHTGYTAESLTHTETGGLVVEIDRDTFVTEVEGESGTYTFSYTTEWSADLTDYGITVNGEPENGDSITVVFAAEVRGTITVATPTKLVSTGWNLFNAAQGYARVVKYADRYHVGGTYTQLQFSETLNGERSTITVSGSSFDVPSNGFVWVTGGSAADTYITPEWEDWTLGPNVAFEAYSETSINLSTIMSTYFPNGLMAVGNVYDEISAVNRRAVSRIERLAYNSTNLEAVIEAGRAYVADENYIYAVRTGEVTNTITINGQYTVSDHGLEIFDGTTVGTYLIVLYGQDLKAKLTNDVVTISQQTLTTAQKNQVLSNIGATDLVNSKDTAIRNILNDAIITRYYSKTITVAGGANAYLTASDLGISAISGYTPIAIKAVYGGHPNLLVFQAVAATSGNVMGVKSVATGELSGKTVAIQIVFVKNSLL